jgi:hypothetical protein
MRLTRFLLITSQCSWLLACGGQAGQSGTVDDDVTLSDDNGASDSTDTDQAGSSQMITSDSATEPAGDDVPSDPPGPGDEDAPGCGSGDRAGPCISDPAPPSDSDTGVSDEPLPSGSVNCDVRDSTCTLLLPECPEGLVPEVVVLGEESSDACYGRCVPITACSCQEDDECGAESVCLTSEGYCSAD